MSRKVLTAVGAAFLLLIAVGFAGGSPALAALRSLAGVAHSSATTTAATTVGTHPTASACDTSVKPGYATCFTVRRTDVTGHKGLFAKTAGRDLSTASLKAAGDTSQAPEGYGPADLRSAYDLPSTTAGSGETVAVVDAYDDPNAEADLAVYRAQYGLPACDTANGCFTKVDQDGSTNYPEADTGWAEEESLDLDMVSAICPDCKILLVEANSNQDDDLGAAVNEAVALGAKYVSNSYGGPEDPSDLTLDSEYYNHPGVVVTAATGDEGYGPEYPAASQYVTAVGGTTLTQDSSTTRGWDETAWSGGGSGCSDYDPKPAWQTDAGCDMRTEADVSAVADPDTGVALYDTYGNTGSGWGVVGGTSVATPIIASVYALAGTPVAGTYPSSYPYAHPSALNDVTSGSNSGIFARCRTYLCTAGTGYDGPTGLGTPDGLTAFAGGPHGTVTGTVTSAATGKPVANATVSDGTDTVTTSPDGSYTLGLAPGSYTLSISEYGYTTKNLSVTVTAGQSLTENVALASAPSVTISGTVKDGSGQGWPLYAKVSVPGSPAVTYTSPATGKYTLTVPQDASYDVTVDPVYPGYQQEDKTVAAGTANLTQDFSVPVDEQACAAPGYAVVDQPVGTEETFDGSAAPSGWSVVNASGTTYGWEFDQPNGLGNDTGGDGNYAIAYSHRLATSDPERTEDTELVSPVLDFSGDAAPVVTFDYELLTELPDTEEIEVSTDGGQTWTADWSNSSSEYLTGPRSMTVALPTAADQPDVQVRFHYTADDSYWWQLDDIQFGNDSCQTQAGGLVEGVVTDGNTGHGVNGATVASAANSSVTATTAPTTGDPSIGDGFYYLFVPGTGSQQLTATAYLYGTATPAVTLASGTVTPLNIALPAGDLSVTGGPVSASVAMGGKTTKPLTFTNKGKAPVTVTLTGVPGAYSGPSQAATSDIPVIRAKATLSLAPPSKTSKQATAAKPAVSAQPAGSAWTSIADYPTPIMDNVAVTNPANGYVYSMGGVDETLNQTNAAYVYEPAIQRWAAMAPMETSRDEAEAAFVDGKVIVTGGWDQDGAPISSTEVYDPASNTWTYVSNNPVPHAAGSAVALDGKMYVIGGCDDTFNGGAECEASDVEVYDPSTDTWSTAASYPEPVSYAACGAIGGDIYCAGGVSQNDTTSAATKDAYVYDPATNAWSPVAPLPISLWGSAYSAANGELLLSGGVTGGLNGAITNQGFAYDPATDAWTALPNSPVPAYKAAGACGLYEIGGTGGGAQPVTSDEELPGYGVCGSGVSWLSQSKSSFTLAPGASTTVNLTLNAGSGAITQPGSYNATLTVDTNSPYRMNAIHVAMSVAPPATWTEITGKVTGLACPGGASPLAGVTIQIDGNPRNATLATSANGTYSYWIDDPGSSVTVIAAQDGWQPQAVTLHPVAGHPLTESFTLQPVTC